MQNKSIVKSTIVSVDVWDTVKDLIINNKDVSILDISKATGISTKAIEAQAIQAGWIVKRDLNRIAKTQKELNRVMVEISTQLNDAHNHASAFIEAIQYSHRIKIVRNNDGTLSYRNFEEYPDRPTNWSLLNEDQREALRKYIPPSRLSRFWSDILTVLNFKHGIINFISKMSKASLPKMDVDTITMSNAGNSTPVDDSIEINDILLDSDKAGTASDLQKMINSLNKEVNEPESKEDSDDDDDDT
jgi:hypothetical protein